MVRDDPGPQRSEGTPGIPLRFRLLPSVGVRQPRGFHFAGEHTEALAGYMESAVRSGHRIAREIGPAPGRTGGQAVRAACMADSVARRPVLATWTAWRARSTAVISVPPATRPTWSH